MIERYQLPEQFNVLVRRLYKGSEVEDSFFKDNPKLERLYPSQQDFQIAYANLKRETAKGMMSILDITENGLIIHLNAKSL